VGAFIDVTPNKYGDPMPNEYKRSSKPLKGEKMSETFENILLSAMPIVL
jgi:hypothetical protein